MKALENTLKQIEELNTKKVELKIDANTVHEASKAANEIYNINKQIKALEGQVPVFKQISQELEILNYTEKGEDAKKFYESLVTGGIDVQESFKQTKTLFGEAFQGISEIDKRAIDLYRSLQSTNLPADKLRELIEKMSENTKYPELFKAALEYAIEQEKALEETKRKTEEAEKALQMSADTAGEIAGSIHESAYALSEVKGAAEIAGRSIDENVVRNLRMAVSLATELLNKLNAIDRKKVEVTINTTGSEVRKLANAG